MAVYRRVYDSHHLQADCQERDQLQNPTLGNRVWLPLQRNIFTHEFHTKLWFSIKCLNCLSPLVQLVSIAITKASSSPIQQCEVLKFNVQIHFYSHFSASQSNQLRLFSAANVCSHSTFTTSQRVIFKNGDIYNTYVHNFIHIQAFLYHIINTTILINFTLDSAMTGSLYRSTWASQQSIGNSKTP